MKLAVGRIVKVALSEQELARYARQLILPGFAPAAQEFLRASRVHVVGAGELAGPALVYLATAGIGSVLVDDALDVGAEDSASWLYGADELGEPRVFAAVGALRALTSLSKARPYGTLADPTATVVCAGSPGSAREAAERARTAGLPHVVALADGDGGELVSVPVGAPCYSCASRPGIGEPARPGVAAVMGSLAALEMLLILSGVSGAPRGRRIEFVLGQPQARATERVAGCRCGVSSF
ncbi:MAG TPA: ThiF family adenylyltransferase [Anaeromyxobacteraceae bacterium]|nr:ThiF family adenylyltransferase [Anaeromyxobacteraceae bacterium]